MKNGTLWKDIEGNELHAHGGYILKYNEYYYWYGEDRREGTYVSVYRSVDLKNWEFRNKVLTTESKAEEANIKLPDLSLTNKNGGRVNIERPKVLYNENTKKFVMWMHYENGIDYLEAKCAIATCDTPDGDFVYHGSFNPYGYMSRDCTLFDDDGVVYFISAANDNRDLHVYRLTEDYLNIEEHTKTLFHHEYREAPAVFKHNEKYYMLSSFCTGWKPNQGKYSVADSINGQWSNLKDFGNETTFDSQPTFVLPINIDGEVRFLYWADRWRGSVPEYFKSGYVVLDIKFDENDMPYIEWCDEF